MENFTPVSALLGGMLIGDAAVVMMLSLGRITGVSGIVGGIVGGILGAAGGEIAWRVLFVAGLVAGAFAARAALGTPAWAPSAGLPLLVAAGLLVGFGSRLGSGCTSGHGICGLARLSPRSLVATLTFMAAGIATVFVARHVLGG